MLAWRMRRYILHTMTTHDLNAVLETAAGPSRALDQAVADTLDAPLRDGEPDLPRCRFHAPMLPSAPRRPKNRTHYREHFSSSVDACLKLIHEKLPAAHWHVGRAEDGVSMYASLAGGRHRAESTRVTVPLALLTVLASYLDQTK